MRVADGVEMLETTGTMMGRENVVHPTLVWDADAVVLVDSGYPGQMPQIRAGMDKAGVPFERLTHVIITHHDIDHIGTLASIRRELGDRVTIMSHEIEKPYVDGDKQALKLEQFEANLATLTDQARTFYQKMAGAFQASRTRVDQTLVDGQELPYAGGIRVILTPGHTLGHICLYLERSQTLVAGDALSIADGKLVRGLAAYNHDTAMATESLKRLAPYDVQAVVCYHGGLFQGAASGRIAELAQG